MGDVFVSVTGQDDNLGDVVLRRRLLESLRGIGKLHVFVGASEALYLAATIDAAHDLAYTDGQRWKAAMIAAATGGKALFVEKPGEIQMDRGSIVGRVKGSIFLRKFVRLGGKALLLGTGARDSAGLLQKIALRFAFRPFAMIGWRDSRTHADFGFGEVMPDWAFGDGTMDPPSESARDTLVVSLRVDRPFPSAEWIASVRGFATRRSLRIAIVCQVKRDLPRCEALARALDGELVPWDDDFETGEPDLRALYRQTAMAISDRLHVLILAATEGALPYCVLDFDEQKIGRHFEAIGYPDTSENVAGLDIDARIARLDRQAVRRTELTAALAGARRTIADIEQRMSAIVA